jgi:hypothetical protein
LLLASTDSPLEETNWKTQSSFLNDSNPAWLRF